MKKFTPVLLLCLFTLTATLAAPAGAGEAVGMGTFVDIAGEVMGGAGDQLETIGDALPGKNCKDIEAAHAPIACGQADPQNTPATTAVRSQEAPDAVPPGVGADGGGGGDGQATGPD